MKNLFNFKWLLLCIVLSIASINQVWAGGKLESQTCIYFDNSVSNWDYNYVYFSVNDEYLWKMMKINHTMLYLYNRTDGLWQDYPYIRFFADDDDEWENGQNVKGWDYLSTHASNGTNTYKDYDFVGYKLFYVMADKTGSWSDIANLSPGYIGDGYSALNKTMTIKAKVSTNGGSTFAETNTPGALTVSSYSFSNYYTCETSTSGNVSAGSASNTLTVGYRADLSLSAADVTGYTFSGWYAGDSRLTTNSSTTDHPNANTTYYAYYKANQCAVRFNKNAEDATGSMSNQTFAYGVAQALTSNSFSRTNYVFAGWSTSPTGSIEYTNGQSVSNLSATDNDIIDLYAVWEDQYGIYGTGDIFDEDWDTWVGFPNTGTNTYGKTITLTEGEAYVFKVVNRNPTTWWGNTQNEGIYTFERDGSEKTLASNGGTEDNLKIVADITGPYIFSFHTDGKLTITFPSYHAITFGIGDVEGSDSEIEAVSTPSFSSGDNVVDAIDITFTKGATKTGYDWKGWYSNSDGTGTLHSSTDANWTSAADTRSADMEVYACYDYHSYSITYKDMGDKTYTGNNLASLPSTHTYNTATALVNGTRADDCTFEGWYANPACTGDPITSLGATAYTDDITLYAKWKSDNFVIYRYGDMASDLRATYDDVESFVGGKIFEQIEYRMEVGALDTWYTLCLPFTVSAVKVWDEGDGDYCDIVPYYRSGGDYYNGHYIIRTPSPATNLAISDFDNWVDPSSSSFLPSSNTPYIIQWHDSYFSGKFVSFFGASGQTIPSFSAGSVPIADDVVNVYGNNSMTSGSVAGAYLLDPYYGSSGAWLRGATADAVQYIAPFECYIRANSGTTAKYRVMRRGMAHEDEATGWDDVLHSENKAQIKVYTITGFPVAQFEDCSFNEVSRRLSAEQNGGVFILRSENESVKVILGE